MTSRSESGAITAFTGTHGAGKSSIVGQYVLQNGGSYYNPDAVARQIHAANPAATLREANALAWAEGVYQLERAIADRTSYTFETTLGGNTIPALLAKAATAGLSVRIWHVGLDSAELHIARVRARVAAGGHDVPEASIRHRFDSSRENLIQLLPSLDELVLYDNSVEGDPIKSIVPQPRLILHAKKRIVMQSCALDEVPSWAKPIYRAAIDVYSF